MSRSITAPTDLAESGAMNSLLDFLKLADAMILPQVFGSEFRTMLDLNEMESVHGE